MSNIDRAAEVIEDWVARKWGHPEDNAYAAASDLADASLLAPELPEPNDPTASFVPDGKGWLLTGQDGPVVWTAPGGRVMIQRIEPGELTPEQAREFAALILAAADYAEAEGVRRADA